MLLKLKYLLVLSEMLGTNNYIFVNRTRRENAYDRLVDLG